MGELAFLQSIVPAIENSLILLENTLSIVNQTNCPELKQYLSDALANTQRSLIFIVLKQGEENDQNS